MSSPTASVTAPTLAEALLARGFTYRTPAPSVRAVLGAMEIVRVSDGVVVTTLKAGPAWDFVHAFDRLVEKTKAATLSAQARWYLGSRDGRILKANTFGNRDKGEPRAMAELVAAGFAIESPEWWTLTEAGVQARGMR